MSIYGETLPHHISFPAEHNAVVPQTNKFNQIHQDSLSDFDFRSLDVLMWNGFPPELRSLEQKGIVASFVQDLFPLGQLTAQHSFIGSWLWHVPEDLHENYAMDIAVESLALAYFAKKAGSTEMLIRSHNAYANALVSLSGALQDHRLRLTSETLCATLLLNFVTMRGKSWITYAGGAGRLIQLRGPDRHRSGFDSTMLMASRGYLVCLPRQWSRYSLRSSSDAQKQISQAATISNRCFLDEDEWRSIQPNDSSFPLMPKNYIIYHEGLNCFAKIPGVIEKFKFLGNNDPSTYRSRVYFETKKARLNMLEWFDKLQSELGLPIRVLLPLPLSPHMVFPSVYEYTDAITAAFVVNYSAYLIQVNNLLDSLEGSNNHLEENIALSEDICMSVVYCSRMAFALPLALSSMPQRYTGWIQNQINVSEIVQGTTTLSSMTR